MKLRMKVVGIRAGENGIWQIELNALDESGERDYSSWATWALGKEEATSFNIGQEVTLDMVAR